MFSEPVLGRNRTPSELDFEATPQIPKPPRSVAGVELSRFEFSKTTGRRRVMTEKGLAYQLETKLSNRNSAFKKLKQQMDKINVLRDLPETTIEQLEEERFKLDNLKDKFNTAFKEHDDLIQSEKEKIHIDGSIFAIGNLLSAELDFVNVCNHLKETSVGHSQRDLSNLVTA